MKISKHKIPLYRGKLIVIQTDDLKEVQKKYNLDPVEGMDGITFQIENKNGIPRYIVAFEGDTTAGIIAHEALHIVTMIFEDIHAYLDMNNEEPQCYLIGWIVDKIHKSVKLK